MIRRTSPRERAGSIAAAVCLVVVLTGAGCGREPVHGDRGQLADLSMLAGVFVPGQPVTIVPGRFWEVDEDSQTWSFRGWANLVVHLDDVQGAGPLRFRFVPDETTSRMHFRAMWDQQLLGESEFSAGDAIVIDIPREALSAGLHHLKVGRIKSADEADLREIADCRFTSIEVESGVIQRLELADRQRLEFVRAFLEDGVTGISKERHGGLLVSGRQIVRVKLSTEKAASVSFRVSAFFAPETRFVVEVDGVDHHVRTGSNGADLRVPVEKGEHEMRLVAEGSAQGLYLWGSPHLAAGRDRGPVILVTLDTTRRDALSIYGGPEAASPNIAGLAESSTVFDHAWATSPWTLPSHASIFTGLYPTRHGAGVSKTRLEISPPTLAELAHEAGFRTAGFSGGELSASRWGLARGFDLYRDPERFETKGDRQTDYAGEWLDHNGDDPFLLFVNYFDPHAMYRAPAEFEELFGVDEHRMRLADVPVWNQVSEGDSAVWRAVVNGEVEPTPAALEYLEAAYHAEVAFLDHQIGRLISMLEEHGLFEQSTIILVADHGEFLGEGGFFSHACRLDPELTEIPLLIKWPGQSVGTRDQRLVSHVDLFGTILDALGIAAPARDGLRLASGDPSAFDRRATVFMEEHENRIHPLYANMKIAPHIYGLQQRDRRQIVWSGGSECAQRSTGEWSSSECEVGWRQRLDELAAVAALPVETDLSAGDEGLTDEMREHLEALGYIR